MTNTTKPTTGELLGVMHHLDEIGALTEVLDVEYSEICRRIEAHEALRDALRDLFEMCDEDYSLAFDDEKDKIDKARAALALLEP